MILHDLACFGTMDEYAFIAVTTKNYAVAKTNHA